jgi:hypothetical protein
VQQVLHILAHSLYTDREIFLRELISNASDALNRVQFEMLTNRDVRDPEAEPAIHISADSEARTITISDSGTGMTREELIEHLGTIAQSSARAFVQQAKEGDKASASEIIGQFGVGFYSVFMVADKVTVTSRSYRPDAPAATWEAAGDATFTIAPGEREARGTTITLHLKEDAADSPTPGGLSRSSKSTRTSSPSRSTSRSARSTNARRSGGAPRVKSRPSSIKTSTASSPSTAIRRCSRSTSRPTPRSICTASCSCRRSANAA